MQSLIDIREVIQSWVKEVTGFSGSLVIWANQDGPRPNKPYVLLNIISGISETTPHPYEVTPSAASPSELRRVGVSGSLTLSVNVFSVQYPQAFDIMQAIKTSLLLDTVRATLNRRQTTTIQISTIQNDSDYAVTIEGVDITITSDSSATDLEIRDALLVAINASSFVSVQASTGATDDELIILDFPGVEYEISVNALLTITDIINSVNLAYIRNTGVTDLTELLETETEGRAQMDVIFTSPLQIADDPGTIQTVEIDNEIDGTTITVG